jgi:glutamate N-acetyltransferase/amino-acid N-acetyltransferase
VLCAVGYSGAEFVEEAVDIDFDDVPAVRGGLAAHTPVPELRKIAALDSYTITINLNHGDGDAVIYACDTTEAYVRINVEE